jgi:DNA-binding helix-hairpin-helix protein with protein kinase domain
MPPEGVIPLELGECLGQGGEARVFALQADPSIVAKLYHHPTPAHADKLAIMIAHPPAQVAVNGQTVIAWPTKRIVAHPATGLVTGFLMPRVAAGVPAAHLHNMKSRLQTHAHFNWRYLLRAAMNLALTFQKVHDSGYVVGDVNDQGVLVTGNAVVALVDCDSFQVQDPASGRVFRCTVGTSLFTPPELAGCSFATVDRTQAHDLFGLAVLIYQFLMGCHPFQVKVASAEDIVSIEDCIRRGLYPDLAPAAAQSPVSPPLYILPRSTRALFREAFGSTPARRPTAASWTDELWTIDREIRSCAVNANHYFAGHLLSCPWCERTTSLGGRDPFPSADAIRRGEHLRRPSSAVRRWIRRPPRPRGLPLVPSSSSSHHNYVARFQQKRGRS